MSGKRNLVIYNPCSLQHYKEYGIGIPMLNERVEKPFAYISQKYGVQATDEALFSKFGGEILKLAHSKEYCEKVENNPDQVVLDTYELIKDDGSYNRYDPSCATLPLSDFVKKALSHINGTILACESAMDSGFSYHLGGGMHHAMSFRPGGFCMFNDMVTAIKYLQQNGKIKNAVIIDMDAHKGDGTAQMTYSDDSIRSFSIHMKDGWPLDKEDKNDPSYIPSSFDIEVERDDDYLSLLKKGLEDFNPREDFAIVVHGADVYKKDELESASLIQLTKEEVLERDKITYNLLKDRGIPQAWVMAGGYGKYVHEIFTQFLDYSLDDQGVARV